MAAISAFGVTQHSQIFSLFLRNRIQCVALYQLHNSHALLNLRCGCYSKEKQLKTFARLRYFRINAALTSKLKSVKSVQSALSD